MKGEGELSGYGGLLPSNKRFNFFDMRFDAIEEAATIAVNSDGKIAADHADLSAKHDIRTSAVRRYLKSFVMLPTGEAERREVEPFFGDLHLVGPIGWIASMSNVMAQL